MTDLSLGAGIFYSCLAGCFGALLVLGTSVFAIWWYNTAEVREARRRAKKLMQEQNRGKK